MLNLLVDNQLAEVCELHRTSISFWGKSSLIRGSLYILATVHWPQSNLLNKADTHRKRDDTCNAEYIHRFNCLHT